MSNLDSPLNRQLPDAWVDRLFDRLTAIYGSQKVGAMWLDVDQAEVKRAWGGARAKYPPAAIGQALEDLPEMPSPWPPTLPEFVAIVREAAEVRRTASTDLRLPAPSDLAPAESQAVKDFRAEFKRFIGRHMVTDGPSHRMRQQVRESCPELQKLEGQA